MSRRGVGLLGWAVFWAGTSLTVLFLLPHDPWSREHAFGYALANWVVAALGSGVGGYLAPSADRDRLWAGPGGFLFGAALYWGLMLTGENLATP